VPSSSPCELLRVRMTQSIQNEDNDNDTNTDVDNDLVVAHDTLLELRNKIQRQTNESSSKEGNEDPNVNDEMYAALRVCEERVQTFEQLFRRKNGGDVGSTEECSDETQARCVLLSKIEESEEELGITNDKISRMKEIIADNERQIVELCTKNDELSTYVAQGIGQWTMEQTDEREKLLSVKDDLTGSLFKTRKAFDEVRVQNEDADGQCSQLEEIYDQMLVLRNSRDHQLHEASTRVQVELEGLKEVEQQTKDKQFEIEEEKQRKLALDQLLHNITSKTVEIERELEMSDAQMEANVQAYNDFYVQMNSVHSNLERIKAENESQSQKYDEQEKLLLSVRNELRSTKRDLHNYLKEEKNLQKRLKALSDDYEKVQRQNDILKESSEKIERVDLKIARREYEKQKRQTEELEREEGRTKRDVLNARNDISQTTKNIFYQEGKLKKLGAEIVKMKKLTESQEKTIDEASAQSKLLTEEKFDVEEKLSEARLSLREKINEVCNFERDNLIGLERSLIKAEKTCSCIKNENRCLSEKLISAQTQAIERNRAYKVRCKQSDQIQGDVSVVEYKLLKEHSCNFSLEKECEKLQRYVDGSQNLMFLNQKEAEKESKEVMLLQKALSDAIDEGLKQEFKLKNLREENKLLETRQIGLFDKIACTRNELRSYKSNLTISETHHNDQIKESLRLSHQLKLLNSKYLSIAKEIEKEKNDLSQLNILKKRLEQCQIKNRILENELEKGPMNVNFLRHLEQRGEDQAVQVIARKRSLQKTMIEMVDKQQKLELILLNKEKEYEKLSLLSESLVSKTDLQNNLDYLLSCLQKKRSQMSALEKDLVYYRNEVEISDKALVSIEQKREAVESI